MASTFINPVVNPDARLGIRSFDETDPVRLYQQHLETDVDVVIRAVYRQVLGNAYVMESERLVVPESQLKRGDISVREFVRRMARSELYRVRFFDNCSRYRSIELNFKHLLGRTPESYEETTAHSQLLDRGGYEAEIDSYIDSDEYWHAFGEDIVPYYRGHKTQTGKKMVGFTHMFQLLRGAASSDKDIASRNRSRLNGSIISNRPSSIAPVIGVSSPVALTDINQLLANVFAKVQPTAAAELERQGLAASQSQRQQIQENEQQIANLQQKLAALRPFATIGAAQVKSDWQPSSAAESAAESLTLLQQIEAQATQIAALQAQIADTSRYAAIGESRLNKWRSRMFNA